jgi:hypothetical protein
MWRNRVSRGALRPPSLSRAMTNPPVAAPRKPRNSDVTEEGRRQLGREQTTCERWVIRVDRAVPDAPARDADGFGKGAGQRARMGFRHPHVGLVHVDNCAAVPSGPSSQTNASYDIKLRVERLLGVSTVTIHGVFDDQLRVIACGG